jgi:hypothetical protein
MGDFFAFLRCGPDHHTLKLLHGKTDTMHHIAFEARDWDHIRTACDFLGVRSCGSQVLESVARIGDDALHHRQMPPRRRAASDPGLPKLTSAQLSQSVCRERILAAAKSVQVGPARRECEIGGIYSFRTSPYNEFSPKVTGRYAALKILGVKDEYICFVVLDGVFDRHPSLAATCSLPWLNKVSFSWSGRPASLSVQLELEIDLSCCVTKRVTPLK